MTTLISCVRHGVPTALSEATTLGRTLKERSADVLAHFDRPAVRPGLVARVHNPDDGREGGRVGRPLVDRRPAEGLADDLGIRRQRQPGPGRVTAVVLTCAKLDLQRSLGNDQTPCSRARVDIGKADAGRGHQDQNKRKNDGEHQSASAHRHRHGCPQMSRMSDHPGGAQVRADELAAGAARRSGAAPTNAPPSVAA